MALVSERVLVTGGAGFLGSHLCERLLPQDDPLQRRPDITRARELLGWEPKVPLRVGLEKTIAWFDRLLSHRQAKTVG